MSTARRAQSAENARAAMRTSVRFLWRLRRMAVSGQLCRVAEVCVCVCVCVSVCVCVCLYCVCVCGCVCGLRYKHITLAHRHPPPSPQKSDTCANPVHKFRRAAPFLQGDCKKSVPSGNLAWSRPVQISTSKIASLAFREIECRALTLSYRSPFCPRSWRRGMTAWGPRYNSVNEKPNV